jgi:hypothetical protein
MLLSTKIVIKNEAERLVYGEVYIPYRLDTDGEFAGPEEIRKACHWYMENSGPDAVDRNHDFVDTNCTIVENFIAKANDPDGFVEKAWVAGGHVHGDDIWNEVLSGGLNGWSMAGKADKERKLVRLTAVTHIKGQTEPSLGLQKADNHRHSFAIKFDEAGRVIPTRTGTAAGHSHVINRTTATEFEAGHAHRFDIDWTLKNQDMTLVEREQNAVELSNIQAKKLSLVAHGAVRRGFKIVKADTYEVIKMDRVVQAILTPSLGLEELVTVPGLEWLNNSKIKAKTQKTDGKTNTFMFKASEDFEPGTLKYLETNSPGVMLCVGILKADADKADAIVIDTQEPLGSIGIEEPGQSPLGMKVMQQCGALMSSVQSALSQAGMTPETAQQSIQNAIDAFQSFMNDTFNQVSTATSSSTSKQEEETMEEKEIRALFTDMFKDEVPKALKEHLPGMLTEGFTTLKEDILKMLKEEDEEVEAKSAADALKSVAETVKTLAETQKAQSESVTAMVEKMDKFMKSGTDTSSHDNDGEGDEDFSKGDDKDKDGVKKDDGKWGGVLFAHHNPKVRAILEKAARARG